jgi:hypothetical protein
VLANAAAVRLLFQKGAVKRTLVFDQPGSAFDVRWAVVCLSVSGLSGKLS